MTDFRSYILPSILAVGLHVVIVVLASSTWFEQEHKPRIQPFKHIQAELIDLKSQKMADEKKKAELKRQQEDKRKAEAKREAKELERKKKLAAEKKRQAEQKRLADKKVAEKKRKEKLAKAEAEQQRKAEARRKADLKQKAAAEEKRKAEAARVAAEKKRKAEAEKKRKQQEVARRKAEAEKKRRAEAERKRQEQLARERALAGELAREERARQIVEQDRTAKASAVAVITSAVSSNWSRPPSARNGMVVEVRIHLFPTGEVDDVYTVKSSGDEAFDLSAVRAVLKAERFPELREIDPVVFDRNLRTITLKFRPEDLRL